MENMSHVVSMVMMVRRAVLCQASDEKNVVGTLTEHGRNI
jgi:hypothetical protein